jgi:hypothetical protein
MEKGLTNGRQKLVVKLVPRRNSYFGNLLVNRDWRHVTPLITPVTRCGTKRPPLFVAQSDHGFDVHGATRGNKSRHHGNRTEQRARQ